MTIVKHRKIFYIISAILLGSSIFAVLFFGLKPSIDFTGGTLINLSYEGEKPEIGKVREFIAQQNIGDASVRPSPNGFVIRTKELEQDSKDSIVSGLSFDGTYNVSGENTSSVGPILGKEALQKSWLSIVLVLLAILFFVAFAFRKVSGDALVKNSEVKLSSFDYGFATVLALFHDVLIPMGVFAILGRTLGTEVDTLFVTALLVTLGFSVHDTIVVFDRVRENLERNEQFKESKDFEQIVGDSISQTMTRSINTTITTLLAIIILYIFGPESIKNFSLALIIGISAGTYSSIFFGSPLLVTMNKRKLESSKLKSS